MNATTAKTQASAAAPGLIVALDLGKYKSVACLHDRATAAARFQTPDTSLDNLRRLSSPPTPFSPRRRRPPRPR